MSAAVGSLADSITATADADGIVGLATWATDWTKAQGLHSDVVFAVRLCVEEAATNIVLYAYDGAAASPPFAAVARLVPEGVQIAITDHGRPFDVAEAAEPGREHDIESATVGGRGIRLMRSFADRMDYDRLGDQNRLTFTFLADRPGPDR